MQESVPSAGTGNQPSTFVNRKPQLMLSQFKNPRFYVMLLADSAIFVTALVGAYFLRFEPHITGKEWLQMLKLGPFIVPAEVAVFGMLGLHRGMWRFTSLVDFWRLAEACLFSTLLALAYVFLCRFDNFSRAVLILDGMLTFLLAGALRMAIRSFYVVRMNPRGFKAYGLPDIRAWLKGTRRVLIIGAGAGGEKILREIIENPQLEICVAGFIDDDPAKHGLTVTAYRYEGISRGCRK